MFAWQLSKSGTAGKITRQASRPFGRFEGERGMLATENLRHVKNYKSPLKNSGMNVNL